MPSDAPRTKPDIDMEKYAATPENQSLAFPTKYDIN